MKILLVMEKRNDAGSIQAVANYVRAGDELGHTLAYYARPEQGYPGVRFATDARAFDYVVFIFESKLRWLSPLLLAPILTAIPRERRAILDADGMYNPTLVIDGYDRNHTSDAEGPQWRALFESLADRVFQPTLEPIEPKARPLPFYGYDPAAVGPETSWTSKRYDIVQVGHNWWRWKQVSRELLPALERIRPQLEGITFIGSWWDATPPWAGMFNLEQAFCVDSAWLHRLKVEVRPAVPFDQVIPVMSDGRINLMNQRPLLNHLKHLTSKYFEIFCADTVPLVMLDPDRVEQVYGPTGRELALHGQVADKLLDVLAQPRKYRDVVHAVRRHLAEHHSYRNRVQELIDALRA